MNELAFVGAPRPSPSSSSQPDFLMTNSVESERVSVSVQTDVIGLAWLDDDFVHTLNRILQLPPGWAGPESRAVAREALVSALEFIRRRLPVTSPRPSVVPTGSGGIQLEWHFSGVDVELEFGADGMVCDVAVADQRRGVFESADSLWEIADELEMALKQGDER